MTGQLRTDEDVLDQALAWRTALERDDADWDGYIAWLEADPRHRRAYDALDLVDAAVEQHRPVLRTLLEAPAPRHMPWYRRAHVIGYAGGAIAAGIALALTIPTLLAPERVQYYAANDMRTRTVTVAKGVAVTLAPSSQVMVHGADAALIELARGEAYFAVQHDPSRSLTVSAGGYSIADIGTRFTVNASAATLKVGVSEGYVSVSAPSIAQPVRVAAGRQLLADGGRLRLSAIAPQDVASWRAGRLSYSNAPLPLVVADVSRYARKRITVEPSLEKARFTGSLVIGTGERLLDDLAAAMDARVSDGVGGARIGAAAR